MAGEIPAKKFDVWRRLYTRFLLEPKPLQESNAAVQVSIQPVTQADELLRTPTIAKNSEDISASAGTYVAFHTVPAGKRWKVTNIVRAATTSGTNVRLNDGSIDTQISVFQTGAEALRGEWFMNENWSIGMDTTGNGADSSKELAIHYLEEDAF